MAKIPGWDKTREDPGASVWVSAHGMRIAVVGVDSMGSTNITDRSQIVGWEVLVTSVKHDKEVSYGVKRTRKEAENIAISMMKRNPVKREHEKAASSDIAAIEKRAKQLMRGKWNGENLPLLYYYILEDANFHTMNNKLTKAGAFGEFKTEKDSRGGEYYVPTRYGEDDSFKNYRSAGGRSWEL